MCWTISRHAKDILRLCENVRTEVRTQSIGGHKVDLPTENSFEQFGKIEQLVVALRARHLQTSRRWRVDGLQAHESLSRIQGFDFEPRRGCERNCYCLEDSCGKSKPKRVRMSALGSSPPASQALVSQAIFSHDPNRSHLVSKIDL